MACRNRPYTHVRSRSEPGRDPTERTAVKSPNPIAPSEDEMIEELRAAWRFVRHAFSDWDVEKLGRDTTLHVVAAVLIALVASQWDRIRWYVTRERADFRRMFGRGAIRSREIVIVLDHQHIRVQSQQRAQLPGARRVERGTEGALGARCEHAGGHP